MVCKSSVLLIAVMLVVEAVVVMVEDGVGAVSLIHRHIYTHTSTHINTTMPNSLELSLYH